MDKFKKYVLEKNVNPLVLSVGIIFILFAIAAFSKQPTINTILVSIGTSLIASAVVVFLTSHYVQKTLSQKDMAEKWGLESIEANRSQMNSIIDSHLSEARDVLDIMAYGLKSMRESQDAVIKERLSRKLKMRIITVNPESDILNQKDKDENKPIGSTAESIKQLELWVKSLSSKYGKRVQLYYIDNLPTELLFRVDDCFYVGPYQIGRESQQTITFEFRDNGKKDGQGFKYYTQYFNRILEKATRII